MARAKHQYVAVTECLKDCQWAMSIDVVHNI